MRLSRAAKNRQSYAENMLEQEVLGGDGVKTPRLPRASKNIRRYQEYIMSEE